MVPLFLLRSKHILVLLGICSMILKKSLDLLQQNQLLYSLTLQGDCYLMFLAVSEHENTIVIIFVDCSYIEIPLFSLYFFPFCSVCHANSIAKYLYKRK
jgi:hypothetical protein